MTFFSRNFVYSIEVIEAEFSKGNHEEVYTREVEQMKPAGVVRKVDQLGRIVLPKSLRKRYQMNEGILSKFWCKATILFWSATVRSAYFAGPWMELLNSRNDTYVLHA